MDLVCAMADRQIKDFVRNDGQLRLIPSENLLQPTKEQNGQILSRSLGLEPNAQEFAP